MVLVPLDEQGEDRQLRQEWTAPVEVEPNIVDTPTPPPSPPTPSFAPIGRPLVNKRFRSQKPDSLRVKIPSSSRSLSSSFRRSYSKAVSSRIDRRDNARFIEQFRYTIVASQLLSGQSVLRPHHAPLRHPATPAQTPNGTSNDGASLSGPGLAFTVIAAAAVAWALRWLLGGGLSQMTQTRALAGLVGALLVAGIGHGYLRRRRLQTVRGRALAEVSTFVSTSQDLDGATSAAVALTQEVELVSRGYRISVPLPPVSRMDERSQSRRCGRLRKAVRICFEQCIPQYTRACDVVKAFSEPLDLEKYYDIYDISDFDLSDALQGVTYDEPADAEALRTFKILAARFHTLRKVFLCTLLALESRGDGSDLSIWSTVAEILEGLNTTNSACYERIAVILREEESFPVVTTPKMPLSPSSERWRSQLRKLNSLSAGIRGLQAKLVLLREESTRSLNEANDVSQLGPSLVAQYDSIGQDLKMLAQSWEEGKAALASGIDRNEKRLSSMSTLLLSPTVSVSGRMSGGVEEWGGSGGVADALKALTGESPASSTGAQSVSSPEAEEVVFEAVALPRARSTLTREQRLARMKADREKADREKAEARESVDNGRSMLRELETVLNLKAKPSNMHAKRNSAGRASL